MTSVLLLADLPALTLYDRPGVLHASPAQGADRPADLLRLARSLLGDHDAVLAVYPGWSAGPGARAVGFLRSALETDRLVGVAVDLPPLALATLAAQLAAVAALRPDPGPLVAAVPLLAGRLVVGAWTAGAPKGAGRVRLATRLWSWLPRTRLLALRQPYAAVVRTEDLGVLDVTSWWPREPVVTVLAGTPALRDRVWRTAPALLGGDPSATAPPAPAARGEGGRSDWSQPALFPVPDGIGPDEPALITPTRHEIATVPAARRWWRARGLVEVVVAASDPHAVADRLPPSSAGRPCCWCAEPVAAGGSCPLCSAASPHRSPRKETS